MLATARSAALIGVDAVLVTVEVDVSPGLPAFNIVGLPDQAVSEARERVRAAIRNSGLPFPAARITVNLAPADLRKEGPMYDLPIALGLLAAQELLLAGVAKTTLGQLDPVDFPAVSAVADIPNSGTARLIGSNPAKIYVRSSSGQLFEFTGTAVSG